MSASLVGSEMCIRDSLGRVGTSTSQGGYVCRFRAAARAVWTAVRAGTTVSYTHLTAADDM
eukprot:11717164-Alexandrium_andersonii.AAC.1